MATETEPKEPTTPYEENILSLARRLGEDPLAKMEWEAAHYRQQGYRRALQDMAPLRESQKTLTKALRDALAIAAPEMQHEIGRLGAILGKAEALEEGGAS